MDFAHPHFAEPRWLWLAVLTPVLVVLLHRYAVWARRRQVAQFATAQVLGQLLQSHSPARRACKNALLVLTVAGVGLALARPQWGETSEVTHALGEDILFVLDCSRSMLAEDVRPNRLSRAKFAVQDFVQQHGRGRVGLVAFAGQAFLQCPLTFDYDAFRESLNAMDDKTIPVPGTDIGRALDEAFIAMEQNERRKIMVLLTDGEDLEGAGVRKAQELAAKGVVVFTLGVGTPAGAPIQVVRETGVAEILRDSSGKVVESRLDEKTLRDIAEATKATYQPLGALGEGMARVRRAVESPTFLPSLFQARKLGVDRFHFFVAGVLVLLVVESLIGTRRKVRESSGV
ncbi:MAG: VWA domain-containing protein [Verrucomicrobia bacterium]|nr:VWA domain-containing protein [Verrucomicrobiota bacterium]